MGTSDSQPAIIEAQVATWTCNDILKQGGLGQPREVRPPRPVAPVVRSACSAGDAGDDGFHPWVGRCLGREAAISNSAWAESTDWALVGSQSRAQGRRETGCVHAGALCYLAVLSHGMVGPPAWGLEVLGDGNPSSLWSPTQHLSSFSPLSHSYWNWVLQSLRWQSG